MSASHCPERLSTLQVWTLVSDTEEAAVQPLREVCGDSVRHLRPRQVAETCAGLLRDANAALRHERAEVARLTGLLAQAEERGRDAQAALGLAELDLQRLRADSQRQRLALATIRDSAARAAGAQSDALSRYAQALLPVVDQGLGVTVTPPLPEIDEEALERRYWQFDSERKRTGAERDAFKGQIRDALRTVGIHSGTTGSTVDPKTPQGETIH